MKVSRATSAARSPTLHEAMAAHRAGDLLSARSAYRALLAEHPDDVNALHLLGTVKLQLGECEAAAIDLRAAASRMPGFAPVRLNLGLALRGCGRLDDAICAFRDATVTQPDHTSAWANLGAAAFAAGDVREARDAFAKVVELPDATDDAYVNLGAAQLRLGDMTGAVASLRRAIEMNPLNVGALLQLASALLGCDDAAGAEATLGRAASIDPHNAMVQWQRGQIDERRGHAAEAIARYRSALALDPKLAEAHYALGCLQWEAGDRDAAIASFDRALDARPEFRDARWVRVMANLAIVRTDSDRDDEVLKSFKAALDDLDRWFVGLRAQEGWGSVGTIQPYFIVYYEHDHCSSLSHYGDLCSRLMRCWQSERQIEMPSIRTSRPRIRVGVISAHLRKHSIWNAIVRGWFKASDPDVVELIAYNLGETEDEESKIARNASTRYVVHKGSARKRLEIWVEEILSDAPDVLLYPEVGLDGLSLQLASMRLAPVQATTWGQPATSGLPTLDYFLSGNLFEPPGAEAHYRERLVRLPNLGVWYEPLDVTPQSPDWTALGLVPDKPILLCPGTPFKYAPAADVVIVETIRRVPDAQVVFFNYEQAGLTCKLRQRILQACAAGGVSSRDALRFIPWQKIDAYYGLMQVATVMLDTVGFSGFNTAIQAVECGLPVMTWEGRFMRGRLASALMSRMELPELVAREPVAFAESVARLCNDAAYRSRIAADISLRRERLFRDRLPVRTMETFLANAISMGA